MTRTPLEVKSSSSVLSQLLRGSDPVGISNANERLKAAVKNRNAEDVYALLASTNDFTLTTICVAEKEALKLQENTIAQALAAYPLMAHREKAKLKGHSFSQRLESISCTDTPEIYDMINLTVIDNPITLIHDEKTWATYDRTSLSKYFYSKQNAKCPTTNMPLCEAMFEDGFLNTLTPPLRAKAEAFNQEALRQTKEFVEQQEELYFNEQLAKERKKVQEAPEQKVQDKAFSDSRVETQFTPKSVLPGSFVVNDEKLKAQIHSLSKQHDFFNTMNQFVGILNLETNDVLLAENRSWVNDPMAELKTSTQNNKKWLGFHICRMQEWEQERAFFSDKNDEQQLTPQDQQKFQNALCTMESVVNELITLYHQQGYSRR